MTSSRKRSPAPDAPSRNGGPPAAEPMALPADSLVVLRQDGEFGYVLNAESTVPPQAWPTVLRRIANLLERAIVDG
jgi:hypothetical protein